jgi:hypothetical protein
MDYFFKVLTSPVLCLPLRGQGSIYVTYTRGNVRHTNRRELDYLCSLDNVNYRVNLGKLHGKGYVYSWTNYLYSHQTICRLFLKIYLREYFLALICYPSRRKCIFCRREGGGDLRKIQKLMQEVSDGKIIYVQCRLCL